MTPAPAGISTQLPHRELRLTRSLGLDDLAPGPPEPHHRCAKLGRRPAATSATADRPGTPVRRRTQLGDGDLLSEMWGVERHGPDAAPVEPALSLHKPRGNQARMLLEHQHQPRGRPDRGPVQDLHRAVQRASRWPCVPVSVSLRGLRPLPLRPVLPERAARRPGHAAAQPRTGLRSGRAGGVGPRRGDALRPGDRPGAGADSPGRARAGAAQRGGARPDRRGLPRQPPRSAAAATEALATARRQTPSAAASRSTGSVSPSPLTATRSTPPPAEELPGRPRADSRRPDAPAAPAWAQGRPARGHGHLPAHHDAPGMRNTVSFSVRGSPSHLSLVATLAAVLLGTAAAAIVLTRTRRRPRPTQEPTRL